MLPILQIGPLALQAPLLVLLIGLVFGLSFAERYSHYHDLSSEDLNRLVFSGIIIGLIAGRISYILTYPDSFLADPISLISPNPALFRLGDVVVFTVLGALIYGSRKKLVFWKTMDALTPTLLIFWIAVSLANLAIGSDYGIAAPIPWGIELWGDLRHPTQLYDLVFSLITLAVLRPAKFSQRDKPAGAYFLLVTACVALSRFATAPFRAESNLIPGGFYLEQVLSWIILISCLVFLRRAFINYHPE